MIETKFTREAVRALVTLFKVVPEKDNLSAQYFESSGIISAEQALTEEGFLLVPYTMTIPMPLYEDITTVCGTNGFYNRQTMHSFDEVMGMPAFEYYFHQITHYLSVAAHWDKPYLPLSEVRIPSELTTTDKVTLIRIKTTAEIVTLIRNFFKTCTAPSSSQIAAAEVLLPFVRISLSEIKSFELQVVYCKEHNIVPDDPTTCLRYLLYSTIYSTLLIKNTETLQKIQGYCRIQNSKLNSAYSILSKASLPRMAEIFFRYKPIFLAYKKAPGCAYLINKIRKLADKYHKALPFGAKDITMLIRCGEDDLINDIIDRTTNMRSLIKMYNSINSQIANVIGGYPLVYTIRNGKAYIDKIKLRHFGGHAFATAILTLERITQRMKEVGAWLNGKTFLVDPMINYAAPTSEKQMTGSIPWGTKVALLKDGVSLGIHWFDQGQRTDLDLHLNSVSQHFGWNGYFSDGSDIAYTGDITSAPHPEGAAEAYYINGDKTYLLSAHVYSGISSPKFKFFMSPNKVENFQTAEQLFTPIPLSFPNRDQMTLGLYSVHNFYFYGGSTSSVRVPKNRQKPYIDGILHKMTYAFSFIDFLKLCGADVITEPSSMTRDTIDIRPQALTPSTLLSIVDGTYGKES